MDTYKSEEEQIAALKKWWNDNGSSLLIGISVALLAVAGWKFYQNKLEQAANEASGLYQQLVEVVTQQATAPAGEASTIEFIADQIKSEHADSEYAIFAALFSAKDAVNNDNLDKAIEELDWAINKSEDARIDTIAKARKARILSAQGNHDDALALLESPLVSSFEAQYAELRGDVLVRTGDKDAAKKSYIEAYKLNADNPQRSRLVEMKLAGLGVKADEI